MFFIYIYVCIILFWVFLRYLLCILLWNQTEDIKLKTQCTDAQIAHTDLSSHVQAHSDK